ncbi:MAG TPA: hypothetical protein VKP30_11700, partial [Polyangiaceae bacterium]|nr:hypothetical protein [Polyangiaceae bacterium]
MKTRARMARLGWSMLVLVGVAEPELAVAQSAADKATARQLATEGIQLFQKERYTDALDKLERAESLFDAPVHLLYIARSQAKLNHLVESAEAYRRLVRTELSANAPQTFKDAVADGQKELTEIEPQIPSLRVQVTPANAKDLRLAIDGESVSTAVIGVDRPVNPGPHVIEVASGGQAPVSRRVDIAIGSKQTVKLELPATTDAAKGNAAASAGAAQSASNATSSSNSEAGASSRDGTRIDSIPTAQPARRRRLRLVAGIDAAGVVPFGEKLDKLPGYGRADDRSVTGRFGPGGGAEVRVGVSI